MDDEIWTVKRILDWIEGYIGQHGDENPRVSAQWLVSEALGVSRMQLFLDSERPLTPEERATLRDWTRRRAAGEPLQYITGEVGFRHITVKVRPGVLIPRPETEVLVSEALSLIPPPPKPQEGLDAELIRRYIELGGNLEGWQHDEDGGMVAGDGAPPISMRESDASENGGFSSIDDDVAEKSPAQVDLVAETPQQAPILVADICTGSACIACSIAVEHRLTRVIATDISPQAVELARENVEALGLEERVDVLECDLGAGIDDTLMGTFDLVVSNPPYIPTGVLGNLTSEVTDYEPNLALDGGEDGLDVFRRLLEWCSVALAPQGAFAFELHETCLDEAAAEARQYGFTDVKVMRDLANRPRILTARKPCA